MNDPCECTVAGFCHRYKKLQSSRHIAICKNEVLTPEKCEAYRANWAKLVNEPLKSTTKKHSSGPGTELKALLASLGITDVIDCNCEKHARQMDQWGPIGCREHFTEICEWLNESGAKLSWWDKLKASGNAVVHGIIIDPMDIAGSLIRLAIERAELVEVKVNNHTNTGLT